MTVAAKLDLRTKEVKLRLCMDFSWHDNNDIPDKHVKLSNLP